jgi:hypothetical protein
VRRFVVEVSEDSPEADFSDVMSPLSRFLKRIPAGFAAIFVGMMLVVSPAQAQTPQSETDSLGIDSVQIHVPGLDSLAVDSLPPLERTRQYLIARRFDLALVAAEEAALERGLGPAARRHGVYADASRDTASVHLYRGMSLELQRMFPEARADYDAFLAIETDSWRTNELRKRYDYVAGQALRFDARVLRDDGLVPESGIARHGVGGFPLYNSSTILVMGQVAYGLTGVLNNSLGLLDHFSDQEFKLMPYAETRLLLDEILPEELYGLDATIDVGGLARVLEVQFLTSGMLHEVSGSLTGQITTGAFSDQSTITISDLQASYTPVGILDLQRELALSIADSIQSRTGFAYSPSRQAFADSVEAYLIDDVGRLLTYGFALEQLLLGEPVEAQALMMNISDLAAQRDLEQFSLIASHSTPPVDNLLQLTATSASMIPLIVDDTADTTTVAVEDTAVAPVVVAVPDEESRTAHVLSAAAARSLGGFAIWGPTNRTFVFDDLQRDDPRAGVAGTLDPTRTQVGESGVPIKVVIPLPPAANNVPSKGK